MPTRDVNAAEEPPRPAGRASATGYRSFSYFIPTALHTRLKAAWWATRDEAEGAPSLAGLVAASFEREADRLEHLYNEGAPFPPAPARARGISRAAAQRQGDWLRGEWERRREIQAQRSSTPSDVDE